MSQNSALSIPFVHAPNGFGYRLLELPPDLLAEASTPWRLHTDASGMARLRTAQGRTYALRQKNTSNALMLLSVQADVTSTGTVTEPETDTEGPPRPGLAVTATLHDTIELVEVAEEKKETKEAQPTPAPPKARGKWHEKFGKGR